MEISKNGKIYTVHEREYVWEVAYTKGSGTVVLNFCKRDFATFEALNEYLKRDASF
jgi:IS1 family transposase